MATKAVAPASYRSEGEVTADVLRRYLAAGHAAQAGAKWGSWPGAWIGFRKGTIRLKNQKSQTVPLTEVEARWIFPAGRALAATEQPAAMLDTIGPLDPAVAAKTYAVWARHCGLL